jgi:hypothetical protein
MGQQIIERDQTIAQSEKTIAQAKKIAQTQQDEMDTIVGQLEEKNFQMAEIEIALQGQKNVWEDKFEGYTDENQSLGAKNIKLDNINKNLIDVNQELTLENENLTAANNKLEDDIENLATANQVLEDNNQVLTDNNQLLADTTRELEQKFQDSTQEQANNDAGYQDLYEQCLEMEKALAATEARETELLTKLEVNHSENNQTEEAYTETIKSLKTQLTASDTANQHLTSEINQKSELILEADQKLLQEQSKNDGSAEKIRASHLAELARLTEKLDLATEQAQQDILEALQNLEAKHLTAQKSALETAQNEKKQSTRKYETEIEILREKNQKLTVQLTDTVDREKQDLIEQLNSEKEQITNKLLLENEELYVTLNQEKEEAVASVRAEISQEIERVESKNTETVEKLRLEISRLKESQKGNNTALDQSNIEYQSLVLERTVSEKQWAKEKEDQRSKFKREKLEAIQRISLQLTSIKDDKELLDKKVADQDEEIVLMEGQNQGWKDEAERLREEV